MRWSWLTTPLGRRDRAVQRIVRRLGTRFWRAAEAMDRERMRRTLDRAEDIRRRFHSQAVSDGLEFEYMLLPFLTGEDGRYLFQVGWPCSVGRLLDPLSVGIALCNLGRLEAAAAMCGERRRPWQVQLADCVDALRRGVEPQLPDDLRFRFLRVALAPTVQDCDAATMP